MYKIAVVVVDDQHVGMAGDGGLDDASGEIGEDLAGVRGKVGKEEAEFVVGGFLVGGCGCVANDGVWERGVEVAGGVRGGWL